MTFVKGQTGNPAGRKPEEDFRRALRTVLREHKGGVEKLRLICQRLVEEAIAGESWAIQEVANRLDGKATERKIVDSNQNVTVTRSDAQRRDERIQVWRQNANQSASDSRGDPVH